MRVGYKGQLIGLFHTLSPHMNCGLAIRVSYPRRTVPLRDMQITTAELAEAEELLNEVTSWTDEEIKQLPLFYQQKARELQRLANHAQE